MINFFPQMQPGAMVATATGSVRQVLRVDWRRNRSLLKGEVRDFWESFWNLKPAPVA
jgi:hypothetical protein